MNCKQCGAGLGDKREDAIFCNGNCKQKHYKRRKKIQTRIKKLQRSIQSENEVIEHWKQIIDDEKNRVLSLIEKKKREVEKNNLILSNLEKLIQLSNLEYYRHLFRKFKRDSYEYNFELEVCYYGTNSEKHKLVKQFRNQNLERKSSIHLFNEKLRAKITLFENAIQKKRRTKLQSNAEQRINKSEKELAIFQEELEELLDIDLDRLPVIPSKKTAATKTKKVSSVRAFSGKEISNLNFEGVQIDGEIGKFLGFLERNKCAIALTGDSGAGKSHFSYSLADGFLDIKLSVGYFTLESGFNRKFKTFASKHSHNPMFKAFQEGTLKDVRTEARNFDCLIIDSFSKISAKAKDFEELRQDFPDTFFIIIFQKTTDGKIRGGSSILFNSTETIDIKVTKEGERLAIMDKSRYDTENFIYSISEKKLIKNDKLPIKYNRLF